MEFKKITNFDCWDRGMRRNLKFVETRPSEEYMVIRKKIDSYQKTLDKIYNKINLIRSGASKIHKIINNERRTKVKCDCGLMIFYDRFDKHLGNPTHYNRLKTILVKILFDQKKFPVEICNFIVDFIF